MFRVFSMRKEEKVITIEVQYAGELGREAMGISGGVCENESHCEDERSSVEGNGGRARVVAGSEVAKITKTVRVHKIS